VSHRVEQSDVTRSSRWLPSWLRSWAADSVALLVSQFAAVAATSALAILLARHLGPKDWGVLSGFLGLSLGLSVLIEFGLTQWLLRELSRLSAGHGRETTPLRARRRAGRIVAASSAVNAALGSTMIVGAVAAAAAFHVRATSAILLVALVTYGALLASCGGLEAVFRARRKLALVVGAMLLEKVLLLLLVSVFLLLRFDLAAIGVAYVLAGLARVVFYITAIVRNGELPLVRPSIRAMRYATRKSIPFAMNSASLNIVPRLDTFILSALSPLAAGYFAVGDRALGPVVIIAVVMSSALYPFLAREPTGSRAGWQAVAILAAAGSVVGATGIALAPPLVPLVFGSDYKDAVPVVQVMLLAVPFIFASNPLLTHVYTARLEHRALGLSLGGISCLGAGAIVAGQSLIGPVGAAGAYTARSMLFLGALALAGRAVPPAARSGSSPGNGRRDSHEPEAPGEPSPASSPGSAA
jgi:O-antigen/teichoic acid export membrane protein